jgi:tetratricopeptide (TPR) repeat protein
MKNVKFRWFVLPVLLIAINSCISIEKLILTDRLSDAEEFCGKQKKEKSSCYKCLAEAYLSRYEYSRAEEMYKNGNIYEEGCLKIADVLLKDEKYKDAFNYYCKANKKIEGGSKIADNLLERHLYEDAFSYYSLVDRKLEGGKKTGDILFHSGKYTDAFGYYSKAFGNEEMGYRRIADNFFQGSYYDLAFLFYKLVNDTVNSNTTQTKLQSSILQIGNGSILSGALPVKGVFVKDYCLFSMDDDYRIVVTGIFSGKSFEVVQCQTSVNDIQFEDSLCYYSEGDIIYSIPLLSDKRKEAFPKHTAPVTDFYSINGKTLSASWDETINLYSSQKTLSFAGHNAAVTCVTANSTYTTCYSGSWDNTIKKWNVEDGKCLNTITTQNPVTDICLTCNDEYLLTLGKTNQIYRWVAQTGKSAPSLEAHEKMVTVLETTPGRKYFISGDFGGIVKIWDALTFKVISTIPAHNSAITSISISEDAKYFVTGAMDHQLKYWRMPQSD